MKIEKDLESDHKMKNDVEDNANKYFTFEDL